MTTGTGNLEKNDRNAAVRSRMVSIYSYGAGILIILLMGNLSALIDAAVHPDIDYFNEEHLIVGGVTTLVTSVLFIIVMFFLSRLRQNKYGLQKLNEELEQKVAERTRQLAESQEKLLQEEKLAMLGRIAGNMGNELRNPLGVMSNAVFFLQTVLPDSDETVVEYLKIIRSEIDNSQRIISDLTDYCSGRSPRTEPVAVHELVCQSRKRCTLPENIGFQDDLPETLPQVLVDPLQMGQVFHNIISNAVQAMPEGGVLRIAGTTHESSLQKPGEETGKFIEISVTDTGPGIAPENLAKLFQPLFTTRSRGIGLGLAIAQKLTEANGGQIEVESVLGKGTTFTVTLPVERIKS